MARIVFHSMAYRGDVFPYVPVANELASRGHEVTYVVPREFHQLFADERFECRHSGTDFSPVTLDRHGDYVARWGRVLSGALLFRLYFGRLMIPFLPELYTAVDDALRGADLLVTHTASGTVSRIAAEKRALPWVVGDVFPLLVPSREYHPIGFPVPQHLGRLSQTLNRAAWSLTSSRLTRALTYERDFAAFRSELGLSTPHGYVIAARFSPYLNLNLTSRAYVTPAADWPANYHTVGFTNWNGPHGGALPEDVAAYLDAGEPPVLVTLGTSAASAAPQRFEFVAAALDALGRRGLYLVSNRANAARLGDRDGVWPFVPLGALLSRCSAVVHSGAHGTNGMVLAAGLPSVVVPQLFDQVWHGQRQEELGTGVLVRRSTVARLRNALQAVVHGEGIRERAAAIGRALRAEDGPGAAADEIEALLGER